MAQVRAVAVEQRARVVVEPVPLAVVPRDEVAAVPGDAVADRRHVARDVGRGVIGMDERVPLQALDLVRRLAGVIQEISVHEQVFPVRAVVPDHRGRGVRERAEPGFAPAQRRLGAGALDRRPGAFADLADQRDLARRPGAGGRVVRGDAGAVLPVPRERHVDERRHPEGAVDGPFPRGERRDAGDVRNGHDLAPREALEHPAAEVLQGMAADHAGPVRLALVGAVDDVDPAPVVALDVEAVGPGEPEMLAEQAHRRSLDLGRVARRPDGVADPQQQRPPLLALAQAFALAPPLGGVESHAVDDPRRLRLRPPAPPHPTGRGRAGGDLDLLVEAFAGRERPRHHRLRRRHAPRRHPVLEHAEGDRPFGGRHAPERREGGIAQERPGPAVPPPTRHAPAFQRGAAERLAAAPGLSGVVQRPQRRVRGRGEAGEAFQQARDLPLEAPPRVVLDRPDRAGRLAGDVEWGEQRLVAARPRPPRRGDALGPSQQRHPVARHRRAAGDRLARRGGVRVGRDGARRGDPAQDAVLAAGFEQADAGRVRAGQRHRRLGQALEHPVGLARHGLRQTVQSAALGLVVRRARGSAAQLVGDDRVLDAGAAITGVAHWCGPPGVAGVAPTPGAPSPGPGGIAAAPSRAARVRPAVSPGPGCLAGPVVAAERRVRAPAPAGRHGRRRRRPPSDAAARPSRGAGPSPGAAPSNGPRPPAAPSAWTRGASVRSRLCTPGRRRAASRPWARRPRAARGRGSGPLANERSRMGAAGTAFPRGSCSATLFRDGPGRQAFHKCPPAAAGATDERAGDRGRSPVSAPSRGRPRRRPVARAVRARRTARGPVSPGPRPTPRPASPPAPPGRATPARRGCGAAARRARSRPVRATPPRGARRCARPTLRRWAGG